MAFCGSLYERFQPSSERERSIVDTARRQMGNNAVDRTCWVGEEEGRREERKKPCCRLVLYFCVNDEFDVRFYVFFLPHNSETLNHTVYSVSDDDCM